MQNSGDENANNSPLAKKPRISNDKKAPNLLTDMKIVNDPIHRCIELPQLLWRIIDTPEFQRLRTLKQLGAGYMIFPAARHSRFEHSIGVSHLGYTWIKRLRDNQPELQITEMDIVAVAIAGLCHDLGHGPFSHVYDGLIQEDFPNSTWQHELGSAEIFLRIVNRDETLKSTLGDINILFIQELILGKKIKGGIEARKGRNKDKYFMYDIVNNERSGFDVDKLDYMLRDAYFCGVSTLHQSSVDRWISMFRAYPTENDSEQIVLCLPDKVINEIFFDVFQLRVRLHNVVYQQQKVTACDYMLKDIMRKSSNGLFYNTSKNIKYSLLEAHKDMEAYIQTNDSILEVIMYLNDPKLKEAQELIRKIQTRDLYKCCGKVDIHETIKDLTPTQISNEIIMILKEFDKNIKKDDIIINLMRVHHGKGSSNPLDESFFYKKGTKIARHISSAKYGRAVLPPDFESPSIRIYAKDKKHVASLTRAFEYWCKNKKAHTPIYSQDVGSKAFTFNPKIYTSTLEEQQELETMLDLPV